MYSSSYRCCMGVMTKGNLIVIDSDANDVGGLVEHVLLTRRAEVAA